MKTFILLAAFWNPETQLMDEFVLDYDLTGTDCVQRLDEWKGLVDHGAILMCQYGADG